MPKTKPAKEFRLVVKDEGRLSNGSRYYIVIWHGNHGVTINPGFASRARADRVARALEPVLDREYWRERKTFMEAIEEQRNA